MSLATSPQQKLDRRKADIERKLASAPNIQIFEDKQPIWQAVQASNEHMKTFGPFVEFAVRWARLIQLNLDAGMSFNKAARRALNEADYDHISGGTLQMAVAALDMAWVHGDKLTNWFNHEHGGLLGYLRDQLDKRRAFVSSVTLRLAPSSA